MKRIFVCYSTKDQKYAHAIAYELNNANFDVWIDVLSLNPGDSLLNNIGGAITDADYLIALISENSVSSSWVTREINIAISNEISNNKTIVIPMVIGNVQIPPFLIDKLHINVSPDINALGLSIDKLLAAIRGGYHSKTDKGLLLQEIMSFNSLCEKMGIEDVSYDKKVELITKMTEVLLKKIFLFTIDNLKERDQEYLADLIENGAEQSEVDIFVASNITNYEQKVTQIVEGFFKEMRNATIDSV